MASVWAVEAPLLSALERLDAERTRLTYIDEHMENSESLPARSAASASKAFVYIYTAAVFEDLLRGLDLALPQDLRRLDIATRHLPIVALAVIEHEMWRGLTGERIERVRRRVELVRRVTSHNLKDQHWACGPDTTLGLLDGHTVSVDHLDCIWEALELPGSWFPSLAHRTAVRELTERRNRIAHWEEHPLKVGAQRTCGDLIRLIEYFRDIVEVMFISISDFLDALEPRGVGTPGAVG